jgi:flagellar L-ring protein precursor FlgH
MNRNWIVASMSAALLAGGAADVRAQTPPDTTRPAQDTVAVRRPLAVSWTADRRDFVVGDILTILVDELTIASADKSDVDEQDRRTRASFEAAFGTATSKSGGAGSFGTGWDSESRVRGQARRQDRLTTEFSVRVVAVEPNGVLSIQGTRTILLDKQEQEVTVTGFVRPQDVTSRNVVDSWRVADAKLAYASNGSMGKPKQGILAKIIGIIWP